MESLKIMLTTLNIAIIHTAYSTAFANAHFILHVAKVTGSDVNETLPQSRHNIECCNV